MEEENLLKIIPIRYIGMTWIPLIIVALFPGGWFFSIIKAILLFWVIITVGSSWKYNWIVEGHQALGIFVTQNTFLFAVILFFNLSSKFNLLIIVWILIGFFAKFSRIKKTNKL